MTFAKKSKTLLNRTGYSLAVGSRLFILWKQQIVIPDPVYKKDRNLFRSISELPV